MQIVNNSLNTSTKAKCDKIFDQARKEIQNYETFPRGWDGYRGIPFARNALTAATRIVDLAACFFNSNELTPDDVTPGPASDGTVDVEICYSGRTLTFLVDTDINKIVVSKSNIASQKSMNLDDDDSLVQQLSWLFT